MGGGAKNGSISTNGFWKFIREYYSPPLPTLNNSVSKNGHGRIAIVTDLSIIDLSIMDLSIIDLSIIDLSIIDLSIIDLSIIDLSPYSVLERHLGV